MLYSGSWSFILYLIVCIYLSEATHFSMPHIFIAWWLEVSKSVRLCLWARSSMLSIFRLHLEVILCCWYLSLPVSLTSHGMIISTFFPVASLGIISYFLCGWEILHSVHVPHSLYQLNCASTISLIACLGYYTLWGQNHRVTHLFLNSFAIFSTPPQFKYETQAGSGSRDGIAAQSRRLQGIN